MINLKKVLNNFTNEKQEEFISYLNKEKQKKRRQKHSASNTFNQ